MKYKKFILLPLFVLLFACDVDRYIGYDNNGQQLIEITYISGNISDFYRHDPIKGVHVQIGSQIAYTNEKGDYSMNYLLSDDEERNKPTPLSFTFPGYYPIEYSGILDPVENTFNRQMVYAAPIVRNTMRRPAQRGSQELICQALIQDYQGIRTLDSVYVVFFQEGSQPDSILLGFPLFRILSDTTAYFQLRFLGPPDIAPYYYIVAKDNEGYSTRFLHTYDPRWPEPFIFDPNG